MLSQAIILTFRFPAVVASEDQHVVPRCLGGVLVGHLDCCEILQRPAPLSVCFCPTVFPNHS